MTCPSLSVQAYSFKGINACLDVRTIEVLFSLHLFSAESLFSCMGNSYFFMFGGQSISDSTLAVHANKKVKLNICIIFIV